MKQEKTMILYNSPLKRSEQRLAWILVLPAFLYLFLVLAFPLGWSITLSFTDKVVGAAADYLGLDNYKDLLSNPDFLKALKNTFVFTAGAMAAKVFFGVILALLMNMNFRGRTLVRALLIIPWTLPNIVSVLNWKWIFTTNGGAINTLLKAMGLIEKNIVWTATPALAMFVVIFVNVWRGSPFIGISVLSKLQTIDQSYYEAAEIDGANAMQRFMYVTFPAIAETLKVATMVSTIWTINEFELVWILTGGGPSWSTQLLSIFSYKTVLTYRKIGLASAVSVVLMPVLLLLISRISRLRDNESL